MSPRLGAELTDTRAPGDMVLETPGLLATKSSEALSAPEAASCRLGPESGHHSRGPARCRAHDPARAAAAAGEVRKNGQKNCREGIDR